ncbi:hypothetical protein [Klebsiella michiganensis]|uniref:hypothetical protein n=1 Tax=Klebsiella michiganensis TaxID=1134687 RepID=UPI000664E9F1|nr:hypothetical protein [Klebsiella michiganensis]
MTTDITELTPESARESGSILIIVAARMARREFFTPLHALCESGKRVVSTRALCDAVERAEERMVSQVPKIVDGHDRLTKKLKETESRNAELVEALEKAQQAPIMPLGLHPDTQKLVADFCTALAEKLYKAQLKYGYDTDWKQDGWPSQCQAHFHQHIAKGDPRDVAAYCAFMWWHGWSTKPAEGLESRAVTVKLPDYRNTYKSPLADEVEHQVRLALELLSSAAGIKVEAE